MSCRSNVFLSKGMLSAKPYAASKTGKRIKDENYYQVLIKYYITNLIFSQNIEETNTLLYPDSLVECDLALHCSRSE